MTSETFLRLKKKSRRIMIFHILLVFGMLRLFFLFEVDQNISLIFISLTEIKIQKIFEYKK